MKMPAKLEQSKSAIVSMTFVLLAAIFGLAYYNIIDRSLMAQNIDIAIAKGIDPLSVRCSYAKSDDIVCVVFASSAQFHNAGVTGVTIKK
jgi:hypothetical protein